MRIINNFRLIVMLTIVNCVVAACHDEHSPAVDTATRAITACSAHRPMSGELSRAAYIGNISNNNRLLARVITFDTDKVWCDGKFLFTARAAITSYDRETIGNHTGKYPETEEEMHDSYHLIGLYPSNDWAGEAATKSSTLTRAITGYDDIMVAPMQTLTKAEVLAAKSPTLTFAHQLTKLEVRPKAKDAAAVALWSKVTSVQLVDIKAYPTMPNTFTYTLDGSVPHTYIDNDGSNTPLDFYAIDNGGATAVYTDDIYTGAAGSILVDEACPNVAYTLAPAFTPTNNGDVTIRVIAETHDGQTKTFTQPVRIPALPEGGTTAGMTYRISLTFADAGTIIVVAEVADWEDNENGVELEVEEVKPSA